MQTSNYRADIDGLRAIAVLAVIIYHANAFWLPGGFVGVDIFFVISGYLITNIINLEIQERRFSFRQFYLRRIKRILPPFIAVIIATLLTGFFLYSPHEYVDLAKSARYAISFMANHYFAKEQDYFSPAAEEMPLLHMWSLSVEEQYYFLWPSLFLLIRNKLPQYILVIPALLALGSFGLASFWAQQTEHNAQAYYLLPSRFGELMIGSLLALYNRPCKKAIIASTASSIGLLIIIASLVNLNKHSIFPGYNALWPCIGSALLIFAGTCQQQPFINRLLAKPGIVFIGLLSYSLYLWHWPILAFVRYCFMTTELSNAWIFICLSSTLVISYLSWRYIETPIRKKNFSFRSALKYVFIYPSIILFIYFSLIKSTDGYLLRDSSLRLDTIDSPSLVCHNDFNMKCHAGAKNLPAKTLIVGDSHAAHLTTFFDLLGQQQGWASDILSVDSCPPLLQTDLLSLSHPKQRKRCEKLIQHIKSSIDQYDTVIYAMRWDLHFGFNRIDSYNPSEDFTQHLTDDIEYLSGKNKQVFLVSQAPLYTMNVARLQRTTGKNNPLDNSYITANDILRSLDEKYSHVYYIDTAAIAQTWVNGITNELPAYKDENHFNVYGQKELLKQAGHFAWIAGIIKTTP